MYFDFTLMSFVITLLLIAGVMGAVQGTCAYLILAERKISAWAQDRVGPNRVGFDFGFNFPPFTWLRGLYGLGQPIADGLKFLLKEQVIPAHVDKLFYLIAPCIAVATSLLAIAVVPFGGTTPAPVLLDYRTDAMVARSVNSLTPGEAAKLVNENKEHAEVSRGAVWPSTNTEKAYILAADAAHARARGEDAFPEKVKKYNNALQFVIAPHVDIGVVWLFAIGSLAVYAIVLGGWSSNNKYSFLGSLRSSAQMISYEIPMGMAVLGVFLMAGSLNLEQIIHHQHDQGGSGFLHNILGWNVIYQPMACLLLITSVFAECNRVPFDLPEAEQELVGGYHTEYSGMKFALFFLGEYTHMITTSFVVVAMFFGGWLFPGIDPNDTSIFGLILKLLVFATKMILFVIFYMYIRWTIPRFRFDQLMGLAWKVMMPLGLINLVLVLVVKHYELSNWLLLPLSLGALIAAALFSLRMPRQRTRAPIGYKVHPVTGAQHVSVS